MVPVRLYFEFPDSDLSPIEALDTEMVVRPEIGDTVCLRDFDAELKNDLVAELAESINDSLAASSYNGEIENKGHVSNYKKAVIDFLYYAQWNVESVTVTCKRLEVTIACIPGNPNYKKQ